MCEIKHFILADIGEGIAEVELLKWFVKKGDIVKSFDKICEVQSDKASVEITSRYDGVVSSLHHAEGAIVKVGSTLVDIDTGSSSVIKKPQPPILQENILVKPSQTSVRVKKPFVLADIGEGIAEVELLQWFVKKGDNVKAFDKLCEVQSDKASVEITSRYDGEVGDILHSVGSIVKVGDILVDIIQQGASSSNQAIQEEIVASTSNSPVAPSPGLHHLHEQQQQVSHGKVLTTPAVRRIARENNIDLSLVKATGPKGRIVKEDVLAFLRREPSPTTSAKDTLTDSTTHVSKVHSESPKMEGQSSSSQTVFPIRGVQRLMVKSMTAAREVQHLTLGEEVGMDALVAARKQVNEDLRRRFGSKAIKLSFLPFIIKATSLSLLEYPLLNATVNREVTEIVYHHSHNIGVAMDTPKGLVVPVIRDVQLKSIFTVGEELLRLQEHASKGTLTESHLSGGTFSLSNIGSIGGTYATPVVVVPQVAIGAIGRMQTFPRYINPATSNEASLDEISSGKAVVAPRTVINVSWSADHRVVDGATVARFSNSWKSYLESPLTMMSKLK